MFVTVDVNPENRSCQYIIAYSRIFLFTHVNCGKLAEYSIISNNQPSRRRGMNIRRSLLRLVTVILGTAGLVVLYRDIKARNGGDELQENEPKGFYPGNQLIWIPVKTVFLTIFGFANWWEPKIPLLNRIIRRRLKLLGIENVLEALRLAKHGVIFVVDHRSSADVFMAQIILYLYGLKEIAEFLFFYLVGLRFLSFFRHPISLGVASRDRIAITPPTMIPDKRPPIRDKAARERFKKQVRLAFEIIAEARREVARLLSENRWLWIAPEGSRSKEVVMVQPPAATAKILNHDGAYMLPVALEGTEKMWPLDSWPRPFNQVTMLVGKPLHIDEVRRRAKALEAAYKVSFNRAFVDVVMREIALLHIEKGNPYYAGFYSQSLEEIYEKREE